MAGEVPTVPGPRRRAAAAGPPLMGVAAALPPLGRGDLTRVFIIAVQRNALVGHGQHEPKATSLEAVTLLEATLARRLVFQALRLGPRGDQGPRDGSGSGS